MCLLRVLIGSSDCLRALLLVRVITLVLKTALKPNPNKVWPIRAVFTELGEVPIIIDADIPMDQSDSTASAGNRV